MRSKLLIGGLTAVVAFLLATNSLVAQAAGFITSGDIVNNTVKSADLKNNGIKGKDIKDNTVTGADVNEATLTTVPNATNATNLNGVPAATYLDRVAFTSATAPVAVGAGLSNTLLGPLSITVPAGVNFVRVDGAATMTGGNFGLYWAADAVCSSTGPAFDGAQYTVATTQGNASFHVVIPVTAGVHTYRLCSNNAAATVFGRSLLVETIATGATGGSTITKPAEASDATPGAPGTVPR